MINEEELWYKRGDLVEFKLTLGGGPKRCRGVVLNTAVLYGRAARQIWVLDMDDATPELNARWANKKIIVPEGDVVSLIPSVPIGRDALLRENPVCCPVRDLKRGEWETPAIMGDRGSSCFRSIASEGRRGRRKGGRAQS